MIGQYVQAAWSPRTRFWLIRLGRHHPHLGQSGGSRVDGVGAGLKLNQILENARKVVAIEMLCAAQGIEYRSPLLPAPGTAAMVGLVRAHVPPLSEDRSLTDEIEAIAAPHRRRIGGCGSRQVSDPLPHRDRASHDPRERADGGRHGEGRGWIGRVRAGPGAGTPPTKALSVRVECEGRAVLPGFVDSHTHLVFGGTAQREFSMKMAGAAYTDLAESGGGILSTVTATRNTTEANLFEAAAKRVERMIAAGTTTVEIKSGYGLDLDTELMLLRVARRIGTELPVSVKTTFPRRPRLAAGIPRRPDGLCRAPHRGDAARRRFVGGLLRRLRRRGAFSVDERDASSLPPKSKACGHVSTPIS